MTLQREVQRALQEGLPLVARPYLALADQLGVSEEAVLDAIAQLDQSGLVKRRGIVLRHRSLGYQANAMVVWDVPDQHVDAVGELLGQQPCVTLSYRRPRRLPHWHYNLFCMIHGKCRDEVERQLAEMVERLQLDYPHRVLFSSHCFKQRGAMYV